MMIRFGAPLPFDDWPVLTLPDTDDERDRTPSRCIRQRGCHFAGLCDGLGECRLIAPE